MMDALQNNSLQDLLDRDDDVLSALRISVTEKDLDRLISESLVFVLGDKGSNGDIDASMRHYAVLIVALRDPLDYGKEFLKARKISPAYASVLDGVRFAEEYFTEKALTLHFRSQTDRIKQELGKYSKAISRYNELFAGGEGHLTLSRCEGLLEAFEQLSSLFDVSQEVESLQELIPRLQSEELARIEKAVEEARRWEEWVSNLYEDYVESILLSAESPRTQSELLEAWPVRCISVQRFSVLDEFVRKEADEYWRGSRYTFGDLQKRHFRILDTSIPEVEAAVARVDDLTKYLENAETILNCLFSFTDIPCSCADMKPGVGASSARLAGLCRAIGKDFTKPLRMSLVRATDSSPYFSCADKLAAVCDDRIIQARARELRNCGRLIDEASVLFLGMREEPVELEKFLIDYKGNAGSRKFEASAYPYFADFAPISFLPEGAKLIENNLRQKDELHSCVRRLGVGGNFTWLTNDGYEQCACFEADTKGESWGRMTDYRCREYEASWRECEVQVKEWVPALWPVSGIDPSLGVVKLRSQPWAEDGIVVDAGPCSKGMNVARIPSTTSIPSIEKSLIDLDAKAFFLREEGGERFMLVPIEQFSYAYDAILSRVHLDEAVIRANRKKHRENTLKARKQLKEQSSAI